MSGCLLLLCWIFLVGSCRGVAKEGGGVPLTVSEIIHLFDTIDVGCPMASVEARLGAPIDVEDEDVDGHFLLMMLLN